jgi:cytochrome c2
MFRLPLAVFAAAATLAALPAASQDAELVANGEKVFKRCAACHMVGPEAKNRVGPVLTGVVGRTAGSLQDYNYSDAMVEAGASGLVWDHQTLSAFLADPKAMVKGNKMAFVGVKNPKDLEAVIAYIEANGGE